MPQPVSGYTVPEGGDQYAVVSDLVTMAATGGAARVEGDAATLTAAAAYTDFQSALVRKFTENLIATSNTDALNTARGYTDTQLAKLTGIDPATLTQLRATLNAYLAGISATDLAVRDLGAQATRAKNAADALAAVTDQVQLQVVAADRVRLGLQVTKNQRWTLDLRRIAGLPGGTGPLFQLEDSALAVTAPADPATVGEYTWIPGSERSRVTHHGSSYNWVNWAPSQPSFGGGYSFSDTVGEYVTFTSDANTSALSIRTMKAANGGYGVAIVDGTSSKATALPTAQQEVDAGRLSTSALTNGGGTLNPGDRLIDFYSDQQNYDAHTLICDDLPPGTHTLRINVTGYRRGSAIGARVYSGGYGSAPLATPGSPVTTTHHLLRGVYSAYEYAIEIENPAGTTAEFVGNVHGYDEPGMFRAFVDGYPVDLTGTHNGGEVLVVRTSELRSRLLTGKVADARVAYRLTREGLEVSTRITFAQATRVRNAYLAMYPLAESLSRGVVISHPSVIDLTGGGGPPYPRTLSQFAAAYDPLTGVTAGMWVPDLSAVDSWRTTDTTDGGTWIEDRAGNALNKIYTSRVSTSRKRTYTAGEVITGRTIYRARQLPDPLLALGL